MVRGTCRRPCDWCTPRGATATGDLATGACHEVPLPPQPTLDMATCSPTVPVASEEILLPFPLVETRGYKIQSDLGSRTPRVMNNSVYEQMFRTQSVSDDVLCLELRTRKPSTQRSDKLAVSASAVFGDGT